MKVATGHRLAAAAKRLGVHPIAPKGPAPVDVICAIDVNGDYYDTADIIEAIIDKLEAIEKASAER